MENNYKEFECKVGDIVYDSFHFKGKELKVIKIVIKKNVISPIIIEVEGTRYSYSKFGHLFSQTSPTLSHEPYEVILNLVTKKQVKFNKGDIVGYRFSKNSKNYYIGFYLRKEKSDYVLSQSNTFEHILRAEEVFPLEELPITIKI